MENPSTSSSMENISMVDETPPSTQGELLSAVSETAPGSFQESSSPTLVPQSSKTEPADAKPSNPIMERGTPMDDTSRVKEDEEDDDDDVPLSAKQERLKIVKSASARKHVTVKPTPPKTPRTREI
ncbi:hypothetical protein HAX54_041227 [Datura stramonium]|uniref:Uncharacterized protein n=1 Tax=Datura stramonium TaxID=4076 RepID=A0ABS8VT02_DATST|nr:hypothetical protein [Datura stramonium]